MAKIELIKIRINEGTSKEQTIELTVEEAKDLKAKLNELFCLPLRILDKSFGIEILENVKSNTL